MTERRTRAVEWGLHRVGVLFSVQHVGLESLERGGEGGVGDMKRREEGMPRKMRAARHMGS